MPNLALSLPTGLFGTADYPWTVTVGGTVVDPEWPSVELEEDASGEQSYFRFRVWDATNTIPITERLPVRVQDNATDEPVFLGFVQRRSFEAQAVGRWIRVEAVSIGAWLDEILVPLETRPSGESDQARIAYLWGKYAREPLAFDVSLVTQVRASMPADLFQNLTLRTAIDQVAAQGGDSVRWYVDPAGRLHYFTGTEAGLTAPYNVNVALAPGGGNIAPDDLDVEYDGKIVNRVYVRGANAEGSGWYQDDASVAAVGPVEGYLDAPSADTAAKALSTARLYLGRVAEARARGTFTTGHPYTGWKAGQSITVTSAQHDLSAFATRIVRLRHRFTLGDGKREIRVEFSATQARASSVSGSALGQGMGVPGQVIAGSIFDSSGNPLFSTDAAGGSAHPFGPAARRYMESGLVNSDFALAPPALNSAINPSNALPYWTYAQTSGDAIEAYVAPESDSGSGHVLCFQMRAGAAGDSAHVEQIVPLLSSANRAFSFRPYAYVEVLVTSADAEYWLEVQYLALDGTAIGSAQTTAVEATGIPFEVSSPLVPASTNPPSNAYYARIRIGLRRKAGGATSAIATVQIDETWAIIGPARANVAEVLDPTTYPPAFLVQASGSAVLAPAVGSNGVFGANQPRLAVTAYDAAHSQAGRIGFTNAGITAGGTAFPAGTRTTDELYYRTDLQRWYVYDGTRWVSEQVFYWNFVDYTSTLQPYSASTGAVQHHLINSNEVVWIEEIYASFFVASGGSALSASHKWVGTMTRDTGGTFNTITIDSGASNAWRSTAITHNAAYAAQFFRHTLAWVKTGTPGNLSVLVQVRYRLVAS